MAPARFILKQLHQIYFLCFLIYKGLLQDDVKDGVDVGNVDFTVIVHIIHHTTTATQDDVNHSVDVGNVDLKVEVHVTPQSCIVIHLGRQVLAIVPTHAVGAHDAEAILHHAGLVRYVYHVLLLVVHDDVVVGAVEEHDKVIVIDTTRAVAARDGHVQSAVTPTTWWS